MATFDKLLKNSVWPPQQRAENPFYEAFAGDLSDDDKSQRLKEIFLAATGADSDDYHKKLRYFLEDARNIGEVLGKGLQEAIDNKMTAALAGHLDECRDLMKELGILKDACNAANAAAVSPLKNLGDNLQYIEEQEARAWAMEVETAKKIQFYQIVVESQAAPSQRANLVAAIFVAGGTSDLEKNWRLAEFNQFVDVLHGASRRTAERIAQVTPATASAESLKQEFYNCGRVIEFCDVLKDGCDRAGADFTGKTDTLGSVRAGFEAQQQRFLKLWQLVAGTQKEPDPADKISVYKPLQLKMGAFAAR